MISSLINDLRKIKIILLINPLIPQMAGLIQKLTEFSDQRLLSRF
jgi:hypothetical protein